MSPSPDPDPFAPMKDLAWREIAEIDARLERGEIDEAGWHAEIARLIVPAYLAAETPWEGSGKHGNVRRLGVRAKPSRRCGRARRLLPRRRLCQRLPARVPAALDAAPPGPIRPRHRARAHRPRSNPPARARGPPMRRERAALGSAASVQVCAHRPRVCAAPSPARARRASAWMVRSAHHRRLQRGVPCASDRGAAAVMGPHHHRTRGAAQPRQTRHRLPRGVDRRLMGLEADLPARMRGFAC